MPLYDSGVTSASPNAFDIGSNTYANDALAFLTRDRYNDYLRRFRDLEDQQIAYATDRTKPLTEAQNAISTVQNSFSKIPGQQARRNSKLGIALTPEEQASQQRTTNTAGGLAQVTAANRAATQTYDRQNAIFSGAGGQTIPSTAGLSGVR